MTKLQRALLVVLVSVLPHLFGISSPPIDYHHHRQTQTSTIARNYHRNGMHFLQPQVNWAGPDQRHAATALPVYMYLLGLLWSVFSWGALWGRLLSIMSSAAAAWLLMHFLEDWIDKRAALYAALVFTVLPVEVFFGRTIQVDSFALMYTLGSFVAFDAYLRVHPKKTGT
ncbi:MAG: hypothetical protein V3S11_05050, partial [Elusimicrobiota bacterium]